MATPHYTLVVLVMVLVICESISTLPMKQSDLKALVSIKKSLTEMSPRMNTFFSTWNKTAEDPCSSFKGVTCFQSRVTILSLGTNSIPLAGWLPESISKLSELTQLILAPGIVTGNIPPFHFKQLKKLRVISLPSNRLNGPIPSTLSSLTNLHTLDLSHNQLTGSIPPTLTHLPRLKVLILSFNTLTGPLPTSLSSPLLHLDLNTNLLTGPLPISLPSSLRYLSFSHNLLWGPLTNGFISSSLSQLVFLDLSINHLTGPIPPHLFSLPALHNLFLQRNNLSAGLSSGPTGPTYGEGSTVDLSHNLLSGALPTSLFEGVESLFLNNNRFVGIVPEVYVKRVCRGTTTTLYLQHNYLTGIPLNVGTALPDTASLCLSYNCMVPPPKLIMTCPASAGAELARPQQQCSVFKPSQFSTTNGSSLIN